MFKDILISHVNSLRPSMANFSHLYSTSKLIQLSRILLLLIILIPIFHLGCASGGDGDDKCDFDHLLNGASSEDAETIWVCDSITGDVHECSWNMSFYEDGSATSFNSVLFSEFFDIGEFNWLPIDCNTIEVQSDEIGLWNLEFKIRERSNPTRFSMNGQWTPTDLSEGVTLCGDVGFSCGKGNVEDVFSELPPPTLIEPEDNTTVKQNDPDSGCEFDPVRGYGFKIFFDWTGSEEFKSYELVVRNKNTQMKLFNDSVFDESELLLVDCNGFITDKNLQDWEWFVVGIDNDFKRTHRSETGNFTFEPCRLDNSSPCSDDIRDFSDFMEFNFTRNPGLGFCPPIDSVFSANIMVNENQDYVLNMSILEEGNPETDVCLNGELILEGEFEEAECIKETQLEERLLTSEEIELVKSRFDNIEVFSTPDDICNEIAFDPCLINTFEWDSFLANDFLCSSPHITSSDSSSIIRTIDLLRDGE